MASFCERTSLRPPPNAMCIPFLPASMVSSPFVANEARTVCSLLLFSSFFYADCSSKPGKAPPGMPSQVSVFYWSPFAADGTTVVGWKMWDDGLLVMATTPSGTSELKASRGHRRKQGVAVAGMRWAWDVPYANDPMGYKRQRANIVTLCEAARSLGC